jgi:dipeptidyl aminopeptidase/acylaminoacyl peptidase
MAFKLMLGVRVAVLVIGSITGAVARPTDGPSGAVTGSPIEVADLVRIATIGDTQSLDWGSEPTRNSIASPNGDAVAVVVNYGDPAQGTNNAKLVVFKTADLLSNPKGDVITEFASASNARAIADVRWLADGETLIFSATRGSAKSQVYRFNLRKRILEELSREVTQLVHYEVTPAGSYVLTVSELPRNPPDSNESCRDRGCLVTAERIHAARYGVTEGSYLLSVYDVGAAQARLLPSPESLNGSIRLCHDVQGGMSPDGRFALLNCELRQLPDSWREYTAFTEPRARRCWGWSDTYCDQVLVVMDLQRGKIAMLPDLLFTYEHPAPIWIDGGQRFILPGALESLQNVEQLERSRRAESWALLLLDPVTLEAHRIDRLDKNISRIVNGSWDQGKESLRIEAQDRKGLVRSAICYKRARDQWRRTRCDDRAEETVESQLVVAESLASPPKLVVRSRAGKQSQTVLDPNSWLSDRELGRVEVISWTVRDGLTWTGGLYYPPNFSSGKRYPLLLQTHGFNLRKFSLHGASSNFPGQALAAHGILVLQIGEKFGNHLGTPEEWPIVQAGYEGAIDHLDQLGLVDRNRVGIVGWSRTGPHMGYTITHSPYDFAAGAFTSTVDFGWWGYLFLGAYPSYDTMFGAPPFGAGLQNWLKYSPSFNLDKVRTPMLMWSNEDVGGLWDWYIGLRHLRKPVEYWYLPDGVHELFRVNQRIHTNQLLVDWFRFWLKDEEDSAEAKSDQYRRWRGLRQLRDARASE